LGDRRFNKHRRTPTLRRVFMTRQACGDHEGYDAELTKAVRRKGGMMRRRDPVSAAHCCTSCVVRALHSS
jgi:hypothetical protein